MKKNCYISAKRDKKNKFKIRNLEGYCLLDVTKSENLVGYKQKSSECLG